MFYDNTFYFTKHSQLKDFLNINRLTIIIYFCINFYILCSSRYSSSDMIYNILSRKNII